MTDATKRPNASDTKQHQTRALMLKFDYRERHYELTSLTTNDTVGDLRAVVCSMLNIDDFTRINLKTLQPTKIIDPSSDSKPLSEIFRQTRERIIVEECSGSASHSAPITDLATSATSKASSVVARNPTPSNPLKHHKSESQSPIPLGNLQHQHQLPQVGTADFSALNSSSNLNNEPPFDAFSSSTNSNESPIRQRKVPRNEQSDFPVCSSTGYLLRHPVPSNNSCLFISVHFCLTNGIVDDQIGKSMRKIIADTVASDPVRFDDAFLGKSNAEYCRWILDDNNWGGAIELSILCKYYETEIVAIDVKNTILNRFGEDSHYKQRMLLLYDGLHYDPLKFQPLDDNQPVQTLFSTDNLEVLHLAEELSREAKQSHQFTDVKAFTIRCATCNAELDAKTVSEHAARTGHVNFVERHD